jgi:hypothetical protein
MQLFEIDYQVLSFLVFNILYADSSGLHEDAVSELKCWENAAIEYAKRYAAERGFTYKSHHWLVGDDVGFTRCEVTGCLGDCVNMQLVVMYEV